MKINYQKILLLGLISTIGFLSSCEKDYFIPDKGNQPNPTDTIFYSTDIQPFFDASCIRCHNGGGIPLDLSPDVSYNALMNGNQINTADPKSSKLYVKMTPGESMEKYSTPAETSMTLQWIEQGALDN